MLPFDGASPQRVMHQVLSGEVLPPSARACGIPPAAEAMVLWMLAKSPRARPPSGASLVRLLEAVLASPHDGAHVLAARAAHMRRCKLQDLAALGLRLAGGTLAALAVGWLLWEASELRPDGGIGGPEGGGLQGTPAA